jgi:hypothetical protein
MKILFSVLSLFYIASIFILAESPVVETLSEYNPYSLLHIPLYGILAFLLALSIIPIRRSSKSSSIQQNNASAMPSSKGKASLKVRLFMVGGVSLAVGILDEVHQIYVPGRDASVGDVCLDLVGITFALVLFFGLFKRALNFEK